MGSFPGELGNWMSPAFISEEARVTVPVKELDSSQTIVSLVATYSATLYRVAYSVVRNAAEAEDAVQETFVRVLRNEDKLSEVRDPRVWLIRIVWNVVLDRKRRAKTRPENDDIADYARILPTAEASADDSLVSTETHSRILALIDRLPQKERQALLLSAVDELSTVEIANVLQTTESSVRSRIFRARRLLSDMLEKEGISR
ncbi:RNA polymerase sigma factor [Silvibacterium acidisoli]|uniref:RNA polymerase sigma factor n=1 Tax=Acidobacteriaceae bacterium ZG23-2 TaxID=2883246 RepID=UPI00406CC0E6